MAADGIFSKLSDDALEAYRNLTLSRIVNSDGDEYTLSYLYRDIELAIFKKYYPVLSYCSSPFDMKFVSGIVDSLEKDGLVDISENEKKIKSYKITDSGLQRYGKLPYNYKNG